MLREHELYEREIWPRWLDDVRKSSIVFLRRPRVPANTSTTRNARACAPAFLWRSGRAASSTATTTRAVMPILYG